MPTSLPPCPMCSSPFAYKDAALLICPECGHEWQPESTEPNSTTEEVVRDAHGVELKNGDTVVLIRDLKVKGSSSTIKVGTKVKNIRLSSGDHNIDCKIPGIGAMGLKSEFVKKAEK